MEGDGGFWALYPKDGGSREGNQKDQFSRLSQMGGTLAVLSIYLQRSLISMCLQKCRFYNSSSLKNMLRIRIKIMFCNKLKKEIDRCWTM